MKRNDGSNSLQGTLIATACNIDTALQTAFDYSERNNCPYELMEVSQWDECGSLYHTASARQWEL